MCISFRIINNWLTFTLCEPLTSGGATGGARERERAQLPLDRNPGSATRVDQKNWMRIFWSEIFSTQRSQRKQLFSILNNEYTRNTHISEKGKKNRFFFVYIYYYGKGTSVCAETFRIFRDAKTSTWGESHLENVSFSFFFSIPHIEQNLVKCL
jgi:hypothetical protein